MNRILVVGSGRMGRDLGLWLLRLGHSVCWVSRQPDRLAALRGHVERVLRRWQREGVAGATAADVAFGTPDTLASLAVPDILLEAVEEDADAKRQVFTWASAWRPHEPLLLSATSSFHPSQLHPHCLVTHFFFPVELTGLVEVVCPATVAPHDRERLLARLRQGGMYVLEQTDRQAFAVNRLMLPAHAECARAVGLGLTPAQADGAAATGLLGVAPLALAQRVGQPTIRAALANYVAAATCPDDYRELTLAVADRWKGEPAEPTTAPGLGLTEASDIQQAVQLNTCLRFVQEGLIAERDLDWLLPNFYGRPLSLAACLERHDRKALVARLHTLHRQTGRQYFEPATRLADR